MIIDIVVIIVLLASALISFLRGLVREVLTIFGVVGGLTASYFGGPLLAVYMRGWMGVGAKAEAGAVGDVAAVKKFFDIVPYNLVADTLSYGLIFIVVVIVLSLISHALAESVRLMGLGAIDRTLGVVFGLARGVLLLGVLYSPFHMFANEKIQNSWFHDSRTHIYLEKTAQVLITVLLDRTMQKITKDSHELEQALTAKQKLQNIELLQKDDRGNNYSKSEDNNSHNNGYSDSFRQNMDQLFEQKIKSNDE